MADGCIAPQFLDRLRRFLVLGELEARVLEQLGRFISWHKYNPSQLIYSESDPSTDVWFILDGSVRAVLRTPTGKELIINELGPGDMFGEIAAIDGAGRTASISAISKTRLCSIPAAPFLEAVHSSPAASHALLKALAGVMRHQVRRLQEREALPVRLRLCAELLRLSRARVAGEPGRERVVSPPPKHGVLAARIGSSRETVSRELGELIKKGLVYRSRGAFVLPKPALLQRGLDPELDDGGHHDSGGPEPGAGPRRYLWSLVMPGDLRQLVRRCSAVLLTGLLAACSAHVTAAGDASPAQAPAPGFSADTTTWTGLARGATASEDACRALPGALWVRAGVRTACLRYATIGMYGAVQTPVILLGGDPASATYVSVGGRIQLHREGPGQAPTISTRRSMVEAIAHNYRIPIVILARPGMEGSSGDHPADRHTLAEVELVDDAISQLKARFRFTTLALAGFSSGGTLAANLLSSRSDIGCAVLASSPLNLREFYRGQDGVLGEQAVLRRDLADPMQRVELMRSPAKIWVIGDPRDRKVPPSLWSDWAAEARRHGARVTVAHTAPPYREGMHPRQAYHRDSTLALRIAGACAAGYRGGGARNTGARIATD
jgi:CRP-like cAMP-binding protein/dienelactone hydrolase